LYVTIATESVGRSWSMSTSSVLNEIEPTRSTSTRNVDYERQRRDTLRGIVGLRLQPHAQQSDGAAVLSGLWGW
jgi:hypothetical protein